MGFVRRMDKFQEKYNQSQATQADVLSSPEFNVNRDIKSDYDMWSWIFQEISNLRVEVSRLGVLVRINNSNSPRFLSAYHAHIYSLLIPISVILSDPLWKKVNDLWKSTEKDIETFNKQRVNIPNKRIPTELIRKLDGMYRAALIVGQKAGIGFKTSSIQDFETSVEKAITGGE